VQYAAPLRRPIFHSGEVEYVVDATNVQGFGDSGIRVKDIDGNILGTGNGRGTAAQVEDLRDAP
jgi:hypothetical protein